MLAGAALLWLAPTIVVAQASGEPPTNVRIRVGPLFINPTIGVSNSGVDTNVFNEATSEGPKSDFTFTAVPAADLWLRLRRSWLTANIREDLVYYQKYASERAANTSYQLGYTLPFNRLILKSSATYVNTRERPGFEIDARSERVQYYFGGSLEVRASPKVFVGARAGRTIVDFDKAAVFLGASLHDELSRRTTNAGFTVGYRVTPITTVAVDFAREAERFAFAPLRDSDSTLISAGLRFDPAALIKGSATIGYRNYEPLGGGVPGYRGTTAAVNVSYVFLGITRIGMTLTRDVQSSFDVNQPYYVLTGGTVDVGQHVFGPVDVVARRGLQQLAYRDRDGAAVAVSNRVDHVDSYGGGVGYRLGRNARVGLNIDHNERLSAVDGRRYQGLIFGMSVTYGS